MYYNLLSYCLENQLIFIWDMLVHLKPRKSVNKHQLMQNYCRMTNYNYGTSNAIHCRKNIKTSNLQKVLTNRVSAHGQSLSPKPFETEAIGDLQNFRINEVNKVKQNQLQDNKQKKGCKRNTKAQISTLYKKTFKYNTTLHQILKNTIRKQKLKCQNGRRKIHSLDNQRARVCSYELKINHDQIQAEDNQQRGSQIFETKSGLKLRLLQTIKREFLPLQREEMSSNELLCHANLKFEQQKGNCQGKPSLFEWKTTRPHFTKLHWKRQSKLKSFLKDSIMKSPKNILTFPSESEVTLVDEHPIDLLFEPIDQFKAKQMKDSSNIQAIVNDLEITPKQPKTQRMVNLISQSNYRITKNKKVSFGINTSNHFELPVDGWHIHQRQEEQFHPI